MFPLQGSLVCNTHIHLQMVVWSSNPLSPCPPNWRSSLLFSCRKTTIMKRRQFSDFNER